MHLQCRRCRFDPWVRNISWRRAWQPTPVFLLAKSHGQRSMAGYGPWGHKESETIEATEHTESTGRGYWLCFIWDLTFDGSLPISGSTGLVLKGKTGVQCFHRENIWIVKNWRGAGTACIIWLFPLISTDFSEENGCKKSIHSDWVSFHRINGPTRTSAASLLPLLRDLYGHSHGKSRHDPDNQVEFSTPQAHVLFP